MVDQNDVLLDVITGILPPLLNGMETLSSVGRHLHPPHLAQLIKQAETLDEPVRAALEAFQGAQWPEHLSVFKERVETAADNVCKAADGLRAAADDPNGVFQAYRSLRYNARATEALYPLAALLPPVSQYYLEASARDDEALLAKLAAADATRDEVGVKHASNEPRTRGGYSLYVPEYYDPGQSFPLVMVLHGGSGHGRSFLWTWLREARTRGAILVSPSSRGDTWSLMGPDVDSENFDQILAHVSGQWNVDASRMLLTGMSDGGTFCYVSGLRDNSPFTHLAPISAAFHPLILDTAPGDRLKNLPVYLTHGKLDWMFPADIARTAHQALQEAGADVVYREIEDLSHTYPNDENPRIMDWFLGTS